MVLPRAELVVERNERWAKRCESVGLCQKKVLVSRILSTQPFDSAFLSHFAPSRGTKKSNGATPLCASFLPHFDKALIFVKNTTTLRL